MIEKAMGLPADEVFLDLEDAVAPDAKAEARTQVAVALAEPGWAGQLRGVRINDWTTPWTYADIIEVVSTAGASLDIVVLPKVTDVSHIHALDLLLSQLEATHGLPVGRIGIEVQIENAQGLTNIDAIAAGPRVQALVLGPADMAASLNMRTLEVGEQPRHVQHALDGLGHVEQPQARRTCPVLAVAPPGPLEQQRQELDPGVGNRGHVGEVEADGQVALVDEQSHGALERPRAGRVEVTHTVHHEPIRSALDVDLHAASWGAPRRVGWSPRRARSRALRATPAGYCTGRSKSRGSLAQQRPGNP